MNSIRDIISFGGLYGKTRLVKMSREVQAKKIRKPRAKQFCPVPGCKGVAAPIFGMVCSKHKDVAKSKIARYRVARKAARHSFGSAKSDKSILKTKKVSKNTK